MPTRTDVHAPRNMDPACYTYIGSLDVGNSEDRGYCDRELNAALLSCENGEAQQFKGHFIERMGCDHCGQHNVRYFDGFWYTPNDLLSTRELVMVGWQCADSFMATSTAQRNARRQIKRERERREMERKLSVWLDEKEQNREAFEFMAGLEEDEDRWLDGFLADVLFKARKYGSLSDRQVDAVLRSKQRLMDARDRRTQDQANEPTPSPVIEGRIEITGKLISVKLKSYGYGEVRTVCTILDDRGFKVWGTLPRNVEQLAQGDLDFLRGQRIKLTAQVTKSNNDESFGFYKRPTQAEVIDTD